MPTGTVSRQHAAIGGHHLVHQPRPALLMPIGRATPTHVGLRGTGRRPLSGRTHSTVAFHAHGDTAWRLISHLSLNYLSLTDTDARRAPWTLRELLALYGSLAEMTIRRQVDGVCSVQAIPVTRRAPIPGPIALLAAKMRTVT